jgi:HK97 family phage prohead protease
VSIHFRPLGAGSFELRADGDDGEARTLDARFVPYNTPTRIDARLTEEFLPGAFRAQLKDPSRIPLALGHIPHGGEVIGKVVSLREEADGLYGTARISQTRAGDDALALLRDGVYDAVSIGFREGQSTMVGNVTRRKSATLTELAIVMNPAYSDARVMAVRSQECPDCGCSLAPNGDMSPAAVRSMQEELDDIVARLRPLPARPLP